MGIVISLHNHKGGVCKTTLAREIAAYFALLGYDTLAIDGDQQGTLTHSFRHRRMPGLKRLVKDGAQWNDVLKNVPDQFTGVENLPFALLPSNISTKEIENYSNTVDIIFEAMNAVREAFDIIVVDTAPSIDDIHNGFYFASDYILIPTACTAYSIDAIGDTLAALEDHRKEASAFGINCAKVLGIVPTAFEVTTSIRRTIRQRLYKRYKGNISIYPEMRKLDIWEAAAASRRSIWTLESNNPFEMEAIGRARSDMMPIIESIQLLMPKRAVS